MFWNLSSMGRKFNKDCDYVHSIANEVITKRQETLVCPYILSFQKLLLVPQYCKQNKTRK